MNWRWVAVAMFVVTAGCAGFASEPTPTPTVTPAPVPELESTPTPEPGIAPGVTPRGVQDAERLAAAHLDAIRDTSYVWRSTQSKSSRVANSTANSNSSEVVRVEHERRYVYRTGAREIRQRGNPRFQYNFTEYTEGEARVQQYFEPGSSTATYERERASNATRAYGRTAAGYITLFLDLPEATVVARERNGQQYYHVTGERDSIPALGAVPNATVDATISSDGFVRSLDVTYRNVRGEQTEFVNYRFEYVNVGNTTVERPAWVASQEVELGESTETQ